MQPSKNAVLKSLAILPSGSAGKFLKKIWNLEQLGGEEANFASVLRPPLMCRVPLFSFDDCSALLAHGIRRFFTDRRLTAVLTAVFLSYSKMLHYVCSNATLFLLNIGGVWMSEKKRLTISLSPSVLEDLEKLAKEKGLSKSAMITLILEEYKKGQK